VSGAAAASTRGSPVIEARELTKYFGATCAVDRVSFTLQHGDVIGLLGPNGSGKTTIMRMLTGFFPPTSGQAWIAGRDVQEDSLAVRRRLGYLPEQVVLYPDLPVRRFLEFVATVKGVAAGRRRAHVDEVIGACGLGEVARKLMRKLSRGYRQRVGLAQALLNDPDVLVLDEPTVGLDPRQTVEIRTLIRALAGRRTVLLSTHILPEASMVCDRVIIIDRGRVVAEDTAAGLARRLEGATRTLVRVAGPPAEVYGALAGIAGVERVEAREPAGTDGHTFVVVSTTGEAARGEIAALVVRRGWGLLEVSPLQPTLEELFVRLVGGERSVPADG
jgi:ABC-2 type transport system ATP-binding protein